MTTRPSLDPVDWDAFRTQATAALNDAVDHMQNRSAQPVWQPTPQSVKDSLTEALPMTPTDPAALSARIAADFLPYSTGNTHPRFFGWVHGAGSPSGLIPEIFAVAMNANLGGRDHVANQVEKQVIQWCVDMFDFPPSAGGLVVSGTSMATLIALKSARDKHAGPNTRGSGVGDSKLVGYASDQSHSCLSQAFDIIGLGQNALRRIPVDADFRMDIAALKAQITKDRTAGLQPFCVIGTAGSVNVGAIDPLSEIAAIAAQEHLWFHVDGAFGALAVLNDGLKPMLSGLEQADSLAFDFHKWMHVNYDAAFILMRDSEDQRQSFSDRPDYLEGAERGLAAGNPWFCEYGPELSRGFRALKIWYQMKEHGLARIGEKIADNCAQAAHLADLVNQHPHLTLLAPVALNIACFRFDPGQLTDAELDALNSEIVVEMQMRGMAVPSTTRLNGRLAIRVNITNHRTQISDMEVLVQDICAIGTELSNPERPPS